VPCLSNSVQNTVYVSCVEISLLKQLVIIIEKYINLFSVAVICHCCADEWCCILVVDVEGDYV